MKMSPLTLYCEECGAANSTEDTVCFACQEPLQVTAYSPPPPAPTISSPSTSAGQLLPGSLLNQRYEIVSEVGQGGFSVVYAAKDTQQKNKKVAIKQINLRAQATPDHRCHRYLQSRGEAALQTHTRQPSSHP